MTDIRKVKEFISKWEGGVSDHPDDSGGLTLRGVTQGRYDQYRDQMKWPRRPVTQAGHVELDTIYDQILHRSGATRLPYPLSLVMGDFGFHSGENTAVRFLQRILNRHYQTDVDGVFGPQTKDHAGQYISRYGSDRLANRVATRRHRFLIAIIERRPKDRSFLWGWMRRMADLFKHIHPDD